jgi:hypothetical protein
MRESPQPHSHDGPGDGGNIDFSGDVDGEHIAPASVETPELLGNITNRTESVTNLPGNIYLTKTGANDPTQYPGDIWLQYTGEQIIDQFRDGDIAEYSGDTAAFSVQTTTVLEGSYSLQGTTSGAGQSIFANSGLNYFPEAGDTFAYKVHKLTADVQSMLSFGGGTTDDNNCYRFFARADKGDYLIQKRDGGTNTELDSGGATWPITDTMTWEIDWGTDGSIRFLITDSTDSVIVDTTVQDSTFTTGGIGYTVNTTTTNTNETVFDDGRTVP